MKDEETSENPAPETLADILRDMEADAEAAWEGTPLRRALVTYAARLREALDAPALAPGNAAAMREALVDSLKFWNSISTRTRREENLRLEIAAALDAPARNCDRFKTEREAWDFYLAHTPDNGNIIDGFPTWLYATDPVYGDAAPNA